MELRPGDLFEERGLLTPDQVDAVMRRQRRTGESFGRLAEQVFGVDAAAVEAAIASRSAGLLRTLDLEHEFIDRRAVQMVSPRQAWQFRVLPVRFEADELLVATVEVHLRRALRFLTAVVGVPTCTVLADPESLGEAIHLHRPMAGLGPMDVLRDPVGEA